MRKKNKNLYLFFPPLRDLNFFTFLFQIFAKRFKHATDESNKMNKEIGMSSQDYDENLKNYEKIKQTFDKTKVIL